MNIAREPQVGKVIEEVFAEPPAPFEPVELLRREPQALEKVECLLEPGCITSIGALMEVLNDDVLEELDGAQIGLEKV